MLATRDLVVDVPQNLIATDWRYRILPVALGFVFVLLTPLGGELRTNVGQAVLSLLLVRLCSHSIIAGAEGLCAHSIVYFMGRNLALDELTLLEVLLDGGVDVLDDELAQVLDPLLELHVALLVPLLVVVKPRISEGASSNLVLVVEGLSAREEGGEAEGVLLDALGRNLGRVVE